MARPRVLLLDEPSVGLAPAVVDHLFEIIRAIHAEGVTILLVEQNVVRALEIADRAYVLEEGRVVAGGAPAGLREQTRIQEADLGLRGGGGPSETPEGRARLWSKWRTSPTGGRGRPPPTRR